MRYEKTVKAIISSLSKLGFKVPLTSNFSCSVFLHIRKEHAFLILLPKFQAITSMTSSSFSSFNYFVLHE